VANLSVGQPKITTPSDNSYTDPSLVSINSAISLEIFHAKVKEELSLKATTESENG
jgi:hypothetical protein